jgi:hypothetical protein
MSDIRTLMDRLDYILNEDEVPNQGHDEHDIEQLKAAISHKIKEMPPDDTTAKTLQEIEDLLKHVHAGGKMGIIKGRLKEIHDPSVEAAHNEIARYLMSMEMTPAQRDEMFKLWREDKLVDHRKLLKVGQTTFAEIIGGYNSNPAIREFANEMMRISALGQGKGEFGLSVMSKSIHKQEGKGDLSIDGRPIEVKTTDGGAGRFTDQEVRPAEGFENAARELNKFVTTNPVFPINIPKSGLSLGTAVDYATKIEGDNRKQYLALVEKVITLIFGGESNKEIKAVMTAIEAGNSGAALQAYARAGFDFYMSKKKDEGVLYIDLTKDPIKTVFFKTADDLAASQLRLHANTPYITSISDVRLPYPQTEIITTTFGANARAQAEKKAAKDAKAAEKEAKLAAKQQSIAGGPNSNDLNLRPKPAPRAKR